MQQQWKWYVEAGVVANAVISMLCQGKCAYWNRCADGTNRDLWPLEIEAIDHLLHEHDKFVSLTVYVDRGDDLIVLYPERRLATHDPALLAS